MEEKSAALELWKGLQLTYASVIKDFGFNSNLSTIKEGLDHVLKMLDILNWITISYELHQVRIEIHNVFHLILCTNMLDHISKILEMLDTPDIFDIKISALRILWHI